MLDSPCTLTDSDGLSTQDGAYFTSFFLESYTFS